MAISQNSQKTPGSIATGTARTRLTSQSDNVFSLSGKKYNAKANSSSKTIADASAIAFSETSDEQVTPDSLFPNGISDTNDVAINLLGLAGCSISLEDPNFSLIQTQSDTEVIENKNIFDEKDFSKIKGTLINAADKFSNSADTFYDKDSQTAEFQVTTNKMDVALETKPDAVQIASDFALTNMSAGTPTNKLFQK